MKTTGVRWLDVLRLRWRSVRRRGQVENELDQELRFHIETLVEKYVAEGMTREAATRRATLETGGPEQIKEECRDARGLNFVENVSRDLAYAARSFRQNPGFTITAAATIALAIGVNTALFTIVYSAMLRPLPVHDPDSIRNVYVRARGEGRRASYGTPFFVSYPEFLHMRAHAKSADLAAIAMVAMSRKGDPNPVSAHLVSDNLLRLIGARPQLGRLFIAEDTAKPGSAPVAVLSHSAWQRWLGGARDVVGRTMLLNRTQFTIIGVAQEGMNGPLLQKADVWIPYTMQPVTRPGEPFIHDADSAWIDIFARRRPGFSDDQMRAEMTVLAQQALVSHGSKRTAVVTVEPGALLNLPLFRERAAPILAILFLAVSLVLVVACANVANMLLARGLSRRREIAIRLSIGAGRGRLIQQLMTESVLLAVTAGFLGVALAQVFGNAVLAVVPSDGMSYQVDLSPDGTILLYTAAIALLTGLIFGLVPAWNSIRFDLTPALKSEGLESISKRGRHRLQNAFIAVQAAVCLVLLVNAGLLLRGFQSAISMDVGLARSDVQIAFFDLRQQQYTADQATRFMNTLRENVSLEPGIASASMAFVDPMRDECGASAHAVSADGTAGPEFRVSCDEVGPDFFRTLGIRVVEGREFTRAEMHDESKVVIIDDRFATAHFPGRSAIGQRIKMRGADGPEHEIVGVVASVTPLDLDTQNSPRVYQPMRGLRNTEAKLVVQYRGSPADSERQIRNAVAALDPNVNVRIRRIEENAELALAPLRMAAAAASALGGFALVLACTGVYGVVSFAVSRRRREVGIRVALGAKQWDVLRMVVWQGMKPVGVGAAIGVAAAAAGAQLIRAMLYGLSTLDPIAFGITSALVACVAAVAAAVPARAALRVDPAVTLRHD